MAKGKIRLMKILFVSSWYPPVLSGSSLWAKSLAHALRKRGHEVEVVTTEWAGSPNGEPDKDELRVHKLPAMVAPKTRLLMGMPDIPIAWSLANRRRMVDIVRGFKPDVIHQINHIFDSMILSAHAARKLDVPLVGSITTPVQSTNILKYALMHFTDKLTLYPFGVRHWRKIFCADAELARYVYETYGEKMKDRMVTHIPVGVHEHILSGAQMERAPYPLIVMVGHVHQIRNPTNLILAMVKVREKYPDAKFIIAGRIQYEEPVNAVKRMGLEDCVKFLGLVKPSKVVELVSAATVFAIIHQMKYTSISLTSFEAMQFETPVITNAPESIYGPGVIKNGENIILIDRDSVDQIASAMIRLLDDPNLRARIGHGGKQFVQSCLSWDRSAALTEEVYKEII